MEINSKYFKSVLQNTWKYCQNTAKYFKEL